MRTLLLTERRPAQCQLPGDDLDFLLARHSPHLRITPAREGQVILTPTRLVGLIVGPSSRFVIRPKLPLPSFAYLLDSDTHPSTPDEGKEFNLLDHLALQLSRRIAERVAAGLHHGYAEHHHEGPLVQGRLDLPATLREAPRRDRLHSTRDDLTADVPCNQILRATVDLLTASPLLAEEVRPCLTVARESLAGITSLVHGPDTFSAIAVPSEYRSVLELCRLIAEGLQPAAGRGQPGEGFLIDLERLFERHVIRGIRDAFVGSGLRVEEQRAFHLHDADTGSPAVRLQPDVVIRGEDRVEMVVDAKWKRMRPGRAHPADLYQILAYGSVLGARRLVLVYPGRRDHSRRLRLDNGASVLLHTLRVTAGPQGCARSLRHLGKDLRNSGG